MSEIEHTGHCLCGAVRYRATVAPKWIANCHCASCRRATGAPLTTYAGFPAERFAYVVGEPVRFHSSPGVTRTFCGRCGTPLTYQGERWPGEVHVLTGSMDRPQDYVPTGDAFVEERLPWLHLSARRRRERRARGEDHEIARQSIRPTLTGTERQTPAVPCEGTKRLKTAIIPLHWPARQ